MRPGLDPGVTSFLLSGLNLQNSDVRYFAHARPIFQKRNTGLLDYADSELQAPCAPVCVQNWQRSSAGFA